VAFGSAGKCSHFDFLIARLHLMLFGAAFGGLRAASAAPDFRPAFQGRHSLDNECSSGSDE
jgi:hypothetical protein